MSAKGFVISEPDPKFMNLVEESTLSLVSLPKPPNVFQPQQERLKTVSADRDTYKPVESEPRFDVPCRESDAPPVKKDS